MATKTSLVVNVGYTHYFESTNRWRLRKGRTYLFLFHYKEE